MPKNSTLHDSKENTLLEDMSPDLTMELNFENLDDDETVALVRHLEQESDDFLRPERAKRERLYKLYRSFIDEADLVKGRSNLFIPYTYHLIETVVPRIISAMFASRPFIGVYPVGAGDELGAKANERLLDYQLTQKMKFKRVMHDVIKEALIFGTAITKQTWRLDTRKVTNKAFEPNEEDPDLVEINEYEKEVVTYDDPYILHIDYDDFIRDPYGKDIDDCRYAGNRLWETPVDLKRKAELGVYDEDAVEEALAGLQNYESGVIKRLTSVGLGNNPQRQVAKVVEIWTNEWVVSVANDKVVLRSEPNPLYRKNIPFTKWVDNPVPHEFEGIGEIEAIEGLQYELNTTRNQRIDNVSLIINKMYKILRTADIDPKQLVSRSAGFIEVDSMEDIEELKFQDVTASAYNEESIIKTDMDKTVGVYDIVRGGVPERRETATTSSIRSESANQRFQIKIENMEMTSLVDMAQQLIALNQQFIDRERVVRVLDEDGYYFVNITPEELIGQFDAVPAGSAVEPVVNKEIRQDKLIQLYNVLKDSPFVNHAALVKRMFEAFDIPDTQELIVNPYEGGMMSGGIPGGVPGQYDIPGMMGGTGGGLT